MRRIAHLSDLHFGRTDDLLVTSLTRTIHDLKPDLIVVSGDLTQRARPSQFQEARRFLDTFQCPKIVVPGNHDIPLENLMVRFFTPLANYREHISEDLSPTYSDGEVAILGVNTARSFTRGGGSISDRQIVRGHRFFCGVDPRLVKIIVTHHPFDLSENVADKHLLRGAKHAIAALAECKADLYLAGHSHVPFAGLTERRYTVAHHTALVVQAGTSVSTRTRSEPNSFNLIHIDRPTIAVEHFYWNEKMSQFRSTTSAHFQHTDKGWQTMDVDERKTS